ncbi:MAG: hypothetical protein K1W20_06085, partial [Lachnospiraceae bacterium]
LIIFVSFFINKLYHNHPSRLIKIFLPQNAANDCFSAAAYLSPFTLVCRQAVFKMPKHSEQN